MAYLKHEGNWRDGTVNKTRQFLYRAKYGEFVDKQANGQDASEREWLKTLSVWYEDIDCIKKASSYQQQLTVTKHNIQ